MTTVRKSGYEYVKEIVEAAASGETLYSVDVHQTSFDAVTKTRTVQTGPCTSSMAPEAGAEEMGEYDAKLILIILVKVADRKSGPSFDAAMEDAFAIAKAIGLKVANDNSLGGRVLDCLIGRVVSDFTPVENHPHALVNLPLFINQTGQLLEGQL